MARPEKTQKDRRKPSPGQARRSITTEGPHDEPARIGDARAAVASPLRFRRLAASPNSLESRNNGPDYSMQHRLFGAATQERDRQPKPSAVRSTGQVTRNGPTGDFGQIQPEPARIWRISPRRQEALGGRPRPLPPEAAPLAPFSENFRPGQAMPGAGPSSQFTDSAKLQVLPESALQLLPETPSFPKLWRSRWDAESGKAGLLPEPGHTCNPVESEKSGTVRRMTAEEFKSVPKVKARASKLPLMSSHSSCGSRPANRGERH